MLKIKNSNFKRVRHDVDFELENGILLFACDWNGEYYEGYNEQTNKTEKRYFPVYEQIEEEQFEIIGFEER